MATQSVGMASAEGGDHNYVRSNSLPLVYYFTPFVCDSLARFREIYPSYGARLIQGGMYFADARRVTSSSSNGHAADENWSSYANILMSLASMISWTEFCCDLE